MLLYMDFSYPICNFIISNLEGGIPKPGWHCLSHSNFLQILHTTISVSINYVHLKLPSAQINFIHKFSYTPFFNNIFIWYSFLPLLNKISPKDVDML